MSNVVHLAYYNEFNPYAAQWLRNLIAAGVIMPGFVDERSIEDVRPGDLHGFTQVHLFAGIGGWSYALRCAGWPDSRRIWTASCPCQPYSAAGKGGGFDDERHLWPHTFYLYSQQPDFPDFIGEQVASSIADSWLDLVQADMENLGHAFGCIPFPSAGVGAPHIRDRNYWVAHADNTRLEGWQQLGVSGGDQRPARQGVLASGLADTGGERRIGWQGIPSGRINDGAHAGRLESDDGLVGFGEAGILGSGRPGPTNGFWRDADWLGCRDGKFRPVEPGTFPLVNGVPRGMGRGSAYLEALAALPRKDQGSRQGRLEGYGNAINPEAAAEFIRTVVDVLGY